MSWKLQNASPLRREVDKMQVNLDDAQDLWPAESSAGDSCQTSKQEVS